MKIYIVRSGSGWGGVIGRAIIDTSARTKLNCTDCRRSKDYKCSYDCANCRNSKPSRVIQEFNYDLSLLEAFLPSCELVHYGYVRMDQQIDQVWVTTSNGEWRLVWDTDDETYPTNEALCAKLSKLIDFVI